jgi:hypothetical protein
MSNVTATLKEYGMGKNGTIEPIAIPEFILANSQIALETIVQRNLGYNYNQYEEIAARSLWFANTKTLYNNAGSVVNTAPGVTATAATAKYRSGALTYQYLINLYAYMSGQQIPAYSNGCYGLELHEFALAQLKSSLADRGTGMAATIRRQVEDDFGRMNRWAWLAHEGWVQLDVDNAFAGQQTRVFKINTTDLEV